MYEQAPHMTVMWLVPSSQVPEGGRGGKSASKCPKSTPKVTKMCPKRAQNVPQKSPLQKSKDDLEFGNVVEQLARYNQRI